MLTREKPRSPEPLPKSLSDRPEPKKADRPKTDAGVQLEPHWVALIDGATD